METNFSIHTEKKYCKDEKDLLNDIYDHLCAKLNQLADKRDSDIENYGYGSVIRNDIDCAWARLKSFVTCHNEYVEIIPSYPMGIENDRSSCILS